MKVRSDRHGENFLTIIDIEQGGDMITDDFKELFGNWTQNVLKVGNETFQAKRIKDESGGLESDLNVLNFRVPFVSHRYTVNTKYNFYDFKNKSEHLILFSTLGNEKLMEPDSLGPDFKSKVAAPNPIAGYFIRPRPEGK